MRLINTDMGVVESGLIIGHIGSRGGDGNKTIFGETRY